MEFQNPLVLLVSRLQYYHRKIHEDISAVTYSNVKAMGLLVNVPVTEHTNLCPRENIWIRNNSGNGLTEYDTKWENVSLQSMISNEKMSAYNNESQVEKVKGKAFRHQGMIL